MTINITGVNGGSFANLIPAPEDDEDVDGASVQQVAIAAANQDKFLYDEIANLIDVFEYTFDDETPGIYIEFVGAAGSYADSSTAKVDIPSCAVGDILLIDASTTIIYAVGSPPQDAYLRMAVVEDVTGTPTTTPLDGAKAYLPAGGSATYPVSFTASFVVANVGDARVVYQGKFTNLGDSIKLGYHAARVRVVRVRYGAF